MRLGHALLLLPLAACAVQEAPTSSGKARFAEYPELLIAAFESSCTGPAQTFSRPERDLLECREYLPPEPTAAIILNYDGTTKDLPQLVVQFRTRADGTGYLVENSVFLTVPQKSGPPLRVEREDARLSRTLDRLYRRAGGTPV